MKLFNGTHLWCLLGFWYFWIIQKEYWVFKYLHIFALGFIGFIYYFRNESFFKIW